ncbi:flagellar basal body-associated FliL family protein [Nocardioides perillae]|uniref:Flagellar protein FliL n=1 Tax=Nocardioides perillae TaxID=1119534 RepID=A0A7Y9UVG3_9ACTN|nr:flagellar basal body-associated FliL family protein [Nocardioides perillae]NYG57045.1 flagellar FliL protein [Nocardioides perillae]
MTITAMPGAPAGDAAPEEKKGGKKKLVIVVVLLAVLGGAGYWFFLKPSGPPPPPEPGEVTALEPIQVNLAGGHFLRIGIALQATTTVAHDVEGSKALDAVIHVYSGKKLEEVMAPKEREHLKEELKKEVDHLYHGDVMDVYLTEYVAQ